MLNAISDQISELASNDNYTLHVDGDRKYLTFPAFDGYPELLHLFTTRHGGVSTGWVSSWNFGEQSLDTDENILQNFKILADTMGISFEQFVRTQQTSWQASDPPFARTVSKSILMWRKPFWPQIRETPPS